MIDDSLEDTYYQEWDIEDFVGSFAEMNKEYEEEK
jgi:hypothetical protein